MKTDILLTINTAKNTLNTFFSWKKIKKLKFYGSFYKKSRENSNFYGIFEKKIYSFNLVAGTGEIFTRRLLQGKNSVWFSQQHTNIALVRALRIWEAQRMYWHILPIWGWFNILVKMSKIWELFFCIFQYKSLAEYVVKILALKFEN